MYTRIMEKTCQTCLEIFSTNRSKRLFCSIFCANKFRYKDRFKICKYCLKEFKLTSHNIENIYCSRTCYFAMQKKIFIEKVCRTCHKTFKIENWREKKENFCSIECHYSRECLVKYRKLAFKHLPNECAYCIKGKGRIEVHHIDHDRSNNKLFNLIILCHSCHIKLHHCFPFD